MKKSRTWICVFLLICLAVFLVPHALLNGSDTKDTRASQTYPDSLSAPVEVDLAPQVRIRAEERSGGGIPGGMVMDLFSWNLSPTDERFFSLHQYWAHCVLAGLFLLIVILWNQNKDGKKRRIAATYP